jgi:predicted MFS family arabinose efflux permease
MEIETIKGLKGPVFASIALAFASFGDAFLYPFLPVNASVVEVPIVWVGVLLSINRFVRIFSNSIMVHLFARYGLRAIMIWAVLLAILSTGGYAIASNISIWLFFRICWGVSFSAMRIGTLGYALRSPQQGLALGISRSLQEAGPTIALFFAPLLLKHFDVRIIFLVLASFSLPAVFFAYRLPHTEDTPQSLPTRKVFRPPSIFNLITLITAILIDGIIVVVLGILFLKSSVGITLLDATTLAAFYLGYRRVCLVLFSPAGGWAADKVGLDKIFNVSILLVIIGLLILISGYTTVGIVIVFTFYSITAAITPGTASRNQRHSLSAVAENATWRDIGAAVGTLVGGVLINSPYLTDILLIVIFVLMILLFIHVGASRLALKILYVWK